MEELLFGLFTFIIIYLFYFIFVILRKNKLEAFKNNTYVQFLVKAYKLDLSKISIKKLANTIALANAFIIAVTVVAVGIVSNFILKLLLGLAILIPLQLLIYHIIGKKYQK